MQKRLTDRTLKALKPAKPGTRYDIRDAQQPGLLVRVTDKGTRSFMLQARYPGSTQPARRVLGVYPELSLEKARARASSWRSMLKSGIDPSAAEEAARREEQRRSEQTFGLIAEAFIAETKRKGQRKAAEVERDLRGEFVSRWGKRPITSITSADVVEIIDTVVKRGAPYQAHNLLSTVRRVFSWAIGRDAYGLSSSPCDRLKPKELIGRRAVRQRILTDEELRAFWKAASKIEYPYGPLFKLLLVTIQRKSDVAEAVHSELDLRSSHTLWTIPPERMKADAAHLVPLSPLAVELFSELPRFTKGDQLFSTTFGVKPVNGFSRAKSRLDELMLCELREAASMRGDDPARTVLKPWVIHDLRRTGRTHLSALPIPDLVRELVIAHAKPGLHKVYDQHAYLDEKRHALKLWADRVRLIVDIAFVRGEDRPTGLLNE